MTYVPKPKQTMKCASETCGAVFSTSNRNHKYCSGHCAKSASMEKYGLRSPYSGIATGTVGAIGELLVSADLMRMGYEVFRALSPSSSCDLAILKESKLLRIEVRTGYRGKNGRLYYAKPKNPHDILAIILYDREIEYFPPLIH